MLQNIIAISGKPGLFKLVSSGSKSIIVEELESKKRFPVFGASQVSTLQDIAIYTDTEEVQLGKVLQAIYDKMEGKATDLKKASAKELCDFMEAILPDYDRDRVYPSDMKKLFSWYNILVKHEILPLPADAEEEKEA